ncbi:MAG: O-antigen ligase family protein, partial [Candidatus Methylomirabilota bacterium]
LTELLDRLIHAGLLALAAVSLVVFGAKHPYGQAAAVAIAALLLLAFGIRTALSGEFRLMATPLDLVLVGCLALFLVQLAVGFPFGWISPPSGDALLSAVAAAPRPLPFFPGTLDFHATRQALVLFLMYVIAFYLTIHSLRSRPAMNRLVGGLLVLVAVVAVYGLFEFLSGHGAILAWKGGAGNRVRGTLVNPDHFAATLGMAIPLAIGFLLGTSARRHRRRRHRAEAGEEPAGERGSETSPAPHAPRTAHAASSSGEGEAPSLFEHHRSLRAGESESRRYLSLLCAALLLVAVFFTMSRAGIIAVLAGGAILTTLLWLREPGYRKRLTGLAIGLAALALVAWIGADQVLSRFTAIEMDTQSRGLLYRATLQMARDFPLLGVGLGAFERATPAYAPVELATLLRIDHAHSEPLQLFAEAGLPGLLLLLLALGMLGKEILLRRIFGLSGKPRESRNADVGVEAAAGQASSSPPSTLPTTASATVSPARHDPYNIALAFGALAAVATVLLHSCFDFPLRIPANGILLAMILGIGVSAAAVRFHADRAEPLAPVRTIRLSRRAGLLGLLGVAAVCLFMVWTSLSALLGSEFMHRGYAIMAGAGGPEGRSDRPWLVETGKNREALSYLGSAAAVEGMNPLNQFLLGKLYDQLALRAWNAGLSEEGKFLPDAASRLQAAQRLLDQAAARYATAIALTPSYPDPWSQLGWSAGVRGAILGVAQPQGAAVRDYPALALAGMRQAIALNPQNRYRYDFLAGYAFARLDTKMAGISDPIVLEGLGALQQALELDPAYLPEALSRVLRYTQEPGILHAVIPAHAADSLFAAHLLEEQERWPEAKGLYRRAIELAPDDGKPLYYREYAGALTRHGEDAETRDVLQIVLRFDPENLDLKLAMARSFSRLGQSGEAASMYQAALDQAEKLAQDRPKRRVRPAAAPPRIVLHASREERVLGAMAGRFPETRQAADPLTRALIGLAAFYHEQGQHNLAVPLWEKALQRTPDDDVAAFGLAKSYDAVGAWVSAVDYYKKAIELNRGSIEYRLTLARRYFENDMNFQAINLWRDVLAARPTLIEARLQLGDAYLRLEQYPDALREYERVLQLDPQNMAARVKLMQIRGRLPGV